MELVYYWINKDNCINEQGFCFSPEYSISMLKSKEGIYEVRLEKKKIINIFASEVISNLTVLVGDNGSGKSTFLRNILSINCYPLEKSCNEEYRKYTEEWNEENKNLIILKENDQMYLWTNIHKKDIRISSDFVEGKNAFYVSDNQENLSRKNIINNSAYCEFTKIYISNSYFDEINGIGSHGTLDDLAITPARLLSVAGTFFSFIYPNKLNHKNFNSFDLYSKYLKDNKYPEEFQQICDLLFYNFLIKTEFINEYEGIVQTQIQLKISSVLNLIANAKKEEIDGIKEITTTIDIIRRKYIMAEAKEDPIYILKANLIFEWYLENGVDESAEKATIEEMYSEVEKNIKIEEISENKLYFKEALEEISEFSVIINKLPNIKNTVPQNDMAYQSGKETLKYAKDKIKSASVWAEVIAYVDKRARLNKEICNGNKRYGSFLLRYLNIGNLTFSSGERTFQNIMSWIYYLSQLDVYTVETEHHARNNMILCLDEIDLSLHPAWQRDIVEYLVRLVNNCYKGKHIQIIMTTHSPLCLSNIPRDNIIYLRKTENGTKIDNCEHKETFGTNLYEILNDSFYLGYDLMGGFSKKYIQNLIKEINQLECVKEDDFELYARTIECVGDRLVKNKLKAKLMEKMQRNGEKDIIIKSIDREIAQLEEKRRKIIGEINQ